MLYLNFLLHHLLFITIVNLTLTFLLIVYIKLVQFNP